MFISPPHFTVTHAFITDLHEEDFIFAFVDDQILLTKDAKIPTYKNFQSSLASEQHFYCFASFENKRCILLDDAKSLPETSTLQNFTLRELLKILPQDLIYLYGQASHLHHWHETHRFCGRCGHLNIDNIKERSRICEHCGFVTYPRITPCIITLITREKQLLLGRAERFPEGMYSTLAGFIEPGETVEHAVHREVKEEAGISIKNLKYISSQPWPFPDSLMLGFRGEYESGELVIDRQELEDVKWFDIDKLPILPSPMSIAGQLIEDYLREVKA